MSVDAVGAVLLCLGLLALAGSYLAVIAWAIGDAQQRGYTGCLVLLLFWLCGPIAVPLWLLMRPRKVAAVSPIEYESAEEALEAATKLDKLGEWDAALERYRWTVERWPEHSDYIATCIRAIEDKQSQAQHREA